MYKKKYKAPTSSSGSTICPVGGSSITDKSSDKGSIEMLAFFVSICIQSEHFGAAYLCVWNTFWVEEKGSMISPISSGHSIIPPHNQLCFWWKLSLKRFNMSAWINNTKICHAPPTWQLIIYVLLLPNVWGKSLRVFFFVIAYTNPDDNGSKNRSCLTAALSKPVERLSHTCQLLFLSPTNFCHMPQAAVFVVYSIGRDSHWRQLVHLQASHSCPAAAVL